MNLCIVSENFEIGGAQKVAKFVGTELAKYHKVFLFLWVEIEIPMLLMRICSTQRITDLIVK